ncbi:hypothetical protein [Actinotignum schaalii]|uniref:DUF4878 domain-containing protein n=1 Tax=Actinotignum schaalii FB123-CNA-2 TaxID=883067 RepID=S2VHB3_9ACTO|nr:hypothetical protein [Actinotignum schaalii]EPD26121.1 hypothetical protein HMPREF9237_01396 [Actinotignum schaalii FB123-CNA-2]
MTNGPDQFPPSTPVPPPPPPPPPPSAPTPEDAELTRTIPHVEEVPAAQPEATPAYPLAVPVPPPQPDPEAAFPAETPAADSPAPAAPSPLPPSGPEAWLTAEADAGAPTHIALPRMLEEIPSATSAGAAPDAIPAPGYAPAPGYVPHSDYGTSPQSYAPPSGYGTAPSPAAGPWAQGGMYPAAAMPAVPYQKKSHKKLWISLAVLLVLVVAGVIGFKVTASKFAPEKTAEAYLSAIVEGKASAALEVYDPNVRSGERLFLSDEIYSKATNRPTDFEVISAFKQSQPGGKNTVHVNAEFTIDMKKYPVDLTLSERGKKFLFFSEWQVTDAPLGTVELRSATPRVTINGVDVDLSTTVDPATKGERASEYYSLPAFPGTYTVGAQGGDTFVSFGEAESVSVPVIGPGSSASIEPSFTPEVTAEIQKQVNSRYEACMPANTFEVQDCPELNMSDPLFQAVTEIRRSWKEEPKVEVEASSLRYENGAYVGTAKVKGKAIINYKQRYSEKDPWKESEWPVNIWVNRTLRFEVKDGAITVDFSKDNYGW